MIIHARYMCSKGSYGDHILFQGFSLWNGLRTTVVSADPLVEYRMRHNLALDKSVLTGRTEVVDTIVCQH